MNFDQNVPFLNFGSKSLRNAQIPQKPCSCLFQKRNIMLQLFAFFKFGLLSTVPFFLSFDVFNDLFLNTLNVVKHVS